MTSIKFQNHKITCPHCGATNTVMSNDIRVTTQIDCSKCQEPLGPWGEARLKFGGTSPQSAHG